MRTPDRAGMQKGQFLHSARACLHGCLLAVCLSFVGVSPARADVNDYIGKPIASIRLVIEGKDAADPTLTQALATKVGRPLVMGDVRESVTHLFSLGRFDDVRVDATIAAGGVALVFEL